MHLFDGASYAGRIPWFRFDGDLARGVVNFMAASQIEWIYFSKISTAGDLQALGGSEPSVLRILDGGNVRTEFACAMTAEEEEEAASAAEDVALSIPFVCLSGPHKGVLHHAAVRFGRGGGLLVLNDGPIEVSQKRELNEGCLWLPPANPQLFEGMKALAAADKRQAIGFHPTE